MPVQKLLRCEHVFRLNRQGTFLVQVPFAVVVAAVLIEKHENTFGRNQTGLWCKGGDERSGNVEGVGHCSVELRVSPHVAYTLRNTKKDVNTVTRRGC